MKAVIILLWCAALAAVSLSEHQPPNAGLPLVHAAAPVAPKDRPPIAWRLNSLCLIDEYKQPEHPV